MTPNKNHNIGTPIPIPSSNDIIDVESYVFTPISNKSIPISIDDYDYDRDLTLAIAASLDLIYLSDEEENDEVTVFTSKPSKNREKGESSNSTNPFLCEICTESKPRSDSFGITGCSHSYCVDCVVMYVSSKLQENAIEIHCPVPGCVGSLKLETCRDILPKEIFYRWGFALCEAMIGVTEKFYCPFKDCSALLINDGGEVVIRESERPNCNRLFCAQCKLGWHDGIECKEFQKLNKDEREKEDIMLMKLAESKKWRRCPKCKFYVEKSDGCMYMKCRCGNAFCYNCGAPPKDNSHYCYSCKR